MNEAARRYRRIVCLAMALVLWAIGGIATACEPHVWSDVGYYVPGVRGDTESNARECLQRFGYTPQRGGDVPSRLPAGTVDHTEPVEGSTPVYAGQDGPQVTVTYFVSTGALEIPNVVGMGQRQGERTIAAAGFRVGTVGRQPDEGPADQILDQTPEAGTSALTDTAIDLVVSIEYPMVPNVVDDEESTGTAKLSSAGFEASRQGTEDSEKRSGLIVRTDPVAGTRARPGSAVRYWVTSGRNVVPDVRRMTRDQAAQRLASAGFVLGQAQERADLGDPDVVVDQQPTAESIADVGSGVLIWISKTLLVPNIVGQREEEARVMLQALGLSGVLDGKDASPKPRGEVLATKPPAGTKVLDGTAVRYRMTSGENVVPRVLDLTADEARTALEASGFILGATTGRREAGPQGVVVEQLPTAETSLAIGEPIGIIIRTQRPLVPNVVDKPQQDAERLLKEQTFKLQLVGEEPSPQARGTVLRTDPQAGVEHDVDGDVKYWIASGKNAVPSLIGKTEDEARSEAERAGFKLAEPSYVYSPSAPDRVVQQSPPAGDQAALDALITVQLGSNVPAVPNVLRMTPDEATATLAAVGMTVAPLRKRYGLTGNGRVTGQQPPAGTVARSGQHVQVTLTIASTLPLIIAGSTTLMALLAGAWWTQARPWPWHWPPTIGMRASLEAAGAPWPELGPLDHDPTRDVRMRVALIPGDTTFQNPLLIVRTEVRHE